MVHLLSLASLFDLFLIKSSFVFIFSMDSLILEAEKNMAGLIIN